MIVTVLPDIPGLVARPMDLSQEDGRIIAALVDAEARAEGRESVNDPHEMVTDVGFIPRLDVERDTIILEIPRAGEPSTPVAYAIVQSFRESPGPRVLRHMVKVHPEFRRRGIGSSMLDLCLTRLEELAADAARTDPDGTPMVYRTTIGYDAPGGLALMAERGYRPVAYWADMERSLDDLPHRDLPEGIDLRPVEPSHLRRIWEADVEASRDHWGFVEPTEVEYQEFLAFPHTDHSLWTIAWHDDRVVGQIRSFINHAENEKLDQRVGWTEFIATAREWRGRGIAGSLLCESFRRLADRGMERARLGVHTENPNGAFRLYESYGFEETFRSTEFERTRPA